MTVVSVAPSGRPAALACVRATTIDVLARGCDGAETGSDVETDTSRVTRPGPAWIDLHDPAQRTEVEATITAVPGVLGARLVPGFDRPVDEIHVVASTATNPKRAVRDVQTVMMAKYGVSTDHRVISVATLEVDDVRGPDAPPRIALTRVATSLDAVRVETEVTLHDGEHSHAARADGPATRSGRHHAVARATLDALRSHLVTGTVHELERCAVVDIQGLSVAVTVVAVRGSGGANEVVGSALVRDADDQAVARSVLDALNRHVVARS